MGCLRYSDVTFKMAWEGVETDSVPPTPLALVWPFSASLAPVLAGSRGTRPYLPVDGSLCTSPGHEGTKT